MKKITFKDLAIAFATNQKVNYYDDEIELNQTCRIFSLTEETVSIVSEEYQYDDLSFDKIINIIPRTTQQIINEDYAGGLDMGQIPTNKETIEEAKKYLSNNGYGKGSNFTLNNVANLMIEWQQEQYKNKFSEEDMIEFGKFCHSDAHSINRVKTFKELFEHFKNK